MMELEDCALPLLREIIPTDEEMVAFKDVDVLVGSIPRTDNIKWKDLLKANVAIFKNQGAALDRYAKKTVKVLVVGNPANTNCLIAAKSAPSIPKENFSCLTRLDLNRACTQVAMRCGIPPTDVKNVIIWGNRSSTQYPDVHHCFICLSDQEAACFDVVKDDACLKQEFISGEFTSMGVYSNGNPYGITDDLIYSFPVQIKNKSWEIVQGLTITEFSKSKMDATADELIKERDTALEFLEL